MIFAGYTGSENPVRNRLKIQFVEFDFSKLIFQKSRADQQGVRKKEQFGRISDANKIIS